MKNRKYKHTDLETEPDYPVTLICKDCGDKQTVSGEEADFYEVDNSNFQCEECLGYDPSDDLPGGHPAI